MQVILGRLVDESDIALVAGTAPNMIGAILQPYRIGSYWRW
jgi:hypothetical protein